MDSFERFRKRVIFHSGLAAIVCSVALFLVRPEYGFGFLVGAAASVVNLHLMAVKTPRLTEMSQRDAKGYAFRWAISRYAVLALALGLAAKLEGLNFVCAAGGIFLAQAVLVSNHLVTSRWEPAIVEDEPWKT